MAREKQAEAVAMLEAMTVGDRQMAEDIVAFEVVEVGTAGVSAIDPEVVDLATTTNSISSIGLRATKDEGPNPRNRRTSP